MNKAQLIEALADRLGDKKTAQGAVDGMVDVIIRAVHKGDKVNITGFGVFEKRARAARTARNPRTGETVKVKKTNVPAFRAGSTFKDVVSGQKKLPRVTAANKTTSPTRSATTKAAAKPASRATTSTRGAAKSTSRTTAAKAPATRKTTAKAAPKAATTKRSTTTKAAPKAAAKRTTTRKK